MPTKSKKAKSERRKFKREMVLDTFNIFVAFPSKGLRKFEIKDISKGGFSIYTDKIDTFKTDKNLDMELYLNATLNLPMKVRVAHVSDELIGFEILKNNKKELPIYNSLVDLVLNLSDYI